MTLKLCRTIHEQDAVQLGSDCGITIGSVQVDCCRHTTSPCDVTRQLLIVGAFFMTLNMRSIWPTSNALFRGIYLKFNDDLFWDVL